MSRIWMRLWLGIMGAFLGAGLAFELAEFLVYVLSGIENESALLAWSTVGGFLVSALIAAFIAWYLARPLSAV